jgi:hypothetical protein
MSFLIQDKEVFYCCLVASERHRITPPHSVILNGAFFDSKCCYFRVSRAETEGRRKFTRLLTLANGATLLFKLFCLADPTFSHPFFTFFNFFFSSQNISPYFKESQLRKSKALVFTGPWKTRLILSKRHFLRSYHTTRSNETMPSSVPKGSALGVCKQCQVNDAVENVRSRPMCR